MSIIDSLKEKMRNIKNQLMYNYDQGAYMGKELKKSHKEKIKKMGKKKDGKQSKR